MGGRHEVSGQPNHSRSLGGVREPPEETFEKLDPVLAAQRAKRAVDLLREAKQRGLPNTQLIRSDRAFVPLLRSKDFQQLLQD